MSLKHTTTQLLFLILPILLAGMICGGLMYYLLNQVSTDPSFTGQLLDVAPIFIGISSLFVLALMGYLYHTVIVLKKANTASNSILQTATQKMHNVRKIIEILLKSKLWLPGLQEYIDEDFEGLTYFEVKDFYKGNSKLAIEFLQENHNFSETENLYLEMKSLLYTQPKNGKLAKSLSYPKTYNTSIIEKWIQHKVGSGLWYFFGYKFANFKESLHLENVFERHQDRIMSLALSIDAEVFEENSFNEIFLSKLGEYITKTILPELYKERAIKSSILPRRVNYFTFLLSFLILLGILAPIATLILALPVIILITSYAFICGFLCYLSMAFYQFLKYEITN